MRNTGAGEESNFVSFLFNKYLILFHFLNFYFYYGKLDLELLGLKRDLVRKKMIMFFIE